MERYIVTMVVNADDIDEVIGWVADGVNANEDLAEHCDDWWVEAE